MTAVIARVPPWPEDAVDRAVCGKELAMFRPFLTCSMAVLLLPGVAMFTTTAWIFRHGHPDRRRY